MKCRLALVVMMGTILATTAGAGTMYLSFDGDDGSGSSLAGSGVTIASGDVTFDGSRCRVGAGDSALDFGSILGNGSFTAEFTVHNLAEFNRALPWGWIFAWQARGDAGAYCLYPGGVGGGSHAWLGAPNAAEITTMNCGAGKEGPSSALLGGTTAATIKVDVNVETNEVRVYVAYDADATSSAMRAGNFTLVNTFPWATWNVDPGHLLVQSYDGIGVVDDIIVEGAGVPDFGTPPPGDMDGDGLLDNVETDTGIYVDANDTGTDPNNPDTDGDGLSDGVEDDSGVFVDASSPGTDPNDPDTDSDGANDGAEVSAGSDPLDSNSTPPALSSIGVPFFTK